MLARSTPGPALCHRGGCTRSMAHGCWQPTTAHHLHPPQSSYPVLPCHSLPYGNASTLSPSLVGLIFKASSQIFQDTTCASAAHLEPGVTTVPCSTALPLPRMSPMLGLGSHSIPVPPVCTAQQRDLLCTELCPHTAQHTAAAFCYMASPVLHQEFLFQKE